MSIGQRLVKRLRQPLLDGQDEIRLAIGRMESRAVRATRYDDVRDAEFRVFSQFGEDGIIQYLLANVPVAKDVFVECGVEDYRESNTRFLLENDNWRGLILDAGSAHVEFVSRPHVRWRHLIDARSMFITRENINGTLRDAGIVGDIGLLSMDIDGNDYWVLEAVDAVSPRIIVAEYNSLFGPDSAVSVPYDPAFARTLAHWSNLYFGASLAALCHLADQRGYDFVGSNSTGNNAFFVRRDTGHTLRPLRPAEGYVRSRFREARDEHGELSFIDAHTDGVRLVAGLPLVDVRSGDVVNVADAVAG